MKIKLHHLFLLVCAFTFQGCVTVKINSNKQEGYNKQPKKVFLLIACDKTTAAFCKGWIENIKVKFKEKGIQSDGYVHDPLALDTEDDINNKINTYHPEAVLTIRQTVIAVAGATFEVTLTDNETKRPVWKSELEFSSNDIDNENQDIANRCSNVLIKRLIQDKIISN